MSSRYLSIATTPSVAAAQEQYGSAEQSAGIGALDGFYLACVSATGWPYVQYRGGPAGFLAMVDASMLGFADFRGNRQYITTGNVSANDRVSLFLMDYAHRRRLKIYGHMLAGRCRKWLVITGLRGT
ncbi:hypothetical protein LPJGGPFB_04921 [Ensifer adhaerens]|nr:hypothetical protein [Ensifer adhaerens]